MEPKVGFEYESATALFQAVHYRFLGVLVEEFQSFVESLRRTIFGI